MDEPTVYRVLDPVQNFRVRINIKCVVDGIRAEDDKGRAKNAAVHDASDENEELDSSESESDVDSDDSDAKLRKKEKKKNKSKSKKDVGKADSTIQGQEWSETFSWQEKKFGPRELEKYLSEEDSSGLGRTATDAEYRDQISRQERYGVDLLQDVAPVMLFTYTDKDGFVPKTELTKFVTTSEEFELNAVAESIVTIPENGGRVVNAEPDEENIFGIENNRTDAGDESNVYGTDDGDYASLSKSKKSRSQNVVDAGQRLFRESPFKVFYLMAAVDVETGRLISLRGKGAKGASKTEKDVPGKGRYYEVVLCTIKVNREGKALSMTPGFSTSQLTASNPTIHNTKGNPERNVAWHRFKTPRGSVYEYSLINEADSADPELETEINTVQRQNLETEVSAIEARINNMLLGGPGAAGHLFYNVHLEIVSMSGFEDAASDQLYVQYEMHLPANSRWRWVSTSVPGHEFPGTSRDTNYPLRGVTQTSRQKYVLRRDRDVFKRLAETGRLDDEGCTETRQLVGHLAFPVQAQMLEDNGDGQLGSMPKLYFQVKSRDMWERHRSEGYAYVEIPRVAGCAEFELKTWKVGGSLRQQASEFFIGGAVQLDDTMASAFPQSHSGPFLNRYGTRSETSGSVRVRVHTIIQEYVNAAEAAALDARDKKVRKDGIPCPVAKATVSGVNGANKEQRRKTVSDILNNLRFGRKVSGEGGRAAAPSASASNLVARLNRIRSNRSSSKESTEE